jgi:hypothetical protein
LILGWDIRNTCEAVYKLERAVPTNQKIFFDIKSDSNSTFLMTGSEVSKIRSYRELTILQGEILIYDLSSSKVISSERKCKFG